MHRRGIPTTIYLGAAFKAELGAGLEGHAWLRCGPSMSPAAIAANTLVRWRLLASEGGGRNGWYKHMG
ncbi:MAG: hypothetical protein U0350_25010 [Caldilineaceae bacterium]